ncbi:MAG: ThiF family adenylyltransferase [Promethearchaeota archaeon]
MSKNGDRYHRQTIMPNWDQDKISKATVFLAGVGALGCVVAEILTMMGIGKLVIVDFDTVELSNLNRQWLFRDEDIGKSKALVAKEHLKVLNPSVDVIAFNQKIEDVPESIYAMCDLIVSSLDTFEARRWLNSMCVSVGRPLIDAGLYEFFGHVQVIIPGSDSACLECQPLIPEKRLQQICTLPGEPRKKEREEPKEVFPSVGTISAVIGGIMSQEVVKLLLGLGSPIGYLFYDGLSEEFTKIDLTRRLDCFVCGEKWKLDELRYFAEGDEKIGELRKRIALIYGLANPTMIIGTKIVDDEMSITEAEISEFAPIFVIDSTVAKPIRIRVVLTHNSV